jgi:hypothetical protein
MTRRTKLCLVKLQGNFAGRKNPLQLPFKKGEGKNEETYFKVPLF